MWPFGKSQVQEAHATIDRIERKVIELQERERQAVSLQRGAEVEAGRLREENAIIKKKLREQTEADLYLLSAKIMRDIMDTGKAAPSDLARQQELQVQMRNYTQQQAMSAYPYGLFGASGLSGMSGYGL